MIFATNSASQALISALRPEADRLASVIFSDRGAINADFVGQSPSSLAEAAGFAVTPKTRCLITDQTDIGRGTPLSAEKLNRILAFYEAPDEASGIDLAVQVAQFGGWGHTAVIHCDDPKVVAAYSRIPTGRGAGEHAGDHGRHGLFDRS